MSYQSWSRGKNGDKQTLTFYVDETGADMEPTGVVEVSVEALTEILIELGFFKEDSYY